MATQHLDLDEQEQLAQLKDFWNKYGNLITWLLIAVLGAYAAWNGYKYWQSSQGVKAAVMYDEFDRAVQANDAAKVDRALADLSAGYGKTVYTQQARLQAAKFYYDKGNLDGARTALQGVVDSATDVGYKAVAQLRLASLLAEQKNFDAANKVLAGEFPKGFDALVADRRGDVLALQGKPKEARAEYEKAYTSADEAAPYKRFIEVKMRALGAVPPASAPVAAASQAASGQ